MKKKISGKNVGHTKIAILGATGYIGKSLAYQFHRHGLGDAINVTKGRLDISLFARSKDKIKRFVADIITDSMYGQVVAGSIIFHIKNFKEFNKDSYDVIINCIGISDPAILRENSHEIIRLTEEFDNLILDHIANHSKTLYINMSSGAVYGSLSKPANDSAMTSIDVNAMKESNPYAIAKIYAEAKHRALRHLAIVDLRVFAFFSRFADIHAGFLMSEIAKCLIEKKVFHTSKQDMVRDFSNSEDIYRAIVCIMKESRQRHLNDSFDLISKRPVHKLDLLMALKRKYGFAYEFDARSSRSGPTGAKNFYYSQSKKIHQIGYIPSHTSIESICMELDAMLAIAHGLGSMDADKPLAPCKKIKKRIRSESSDAVA